MVPYTPGWDPEGFLPQVEDHYRERTDTLEWHRSEKPFFHGHSPFTVSFSLSI